MWVKDFMLNCSKFEFLTLRPSHATVTCPLLSRPPTPICSSSPYSPTPSCSYFVTALSSLSTPCGIDPLSAVALACSLRTWEEMLNLHGATYQVVGDAGQGLQCRRCHGRECPSVFQCKSLSLDVISGLGARDPERVLP